MIRLALLFVLVGVLSSLQAAKTHFDIRDAAQRDSVQFISDAPLESVVGMTNAVSGWIELDPKNVRRGVRGFFEVDTRTLLTGMQLRDSHLRNSFLESRRFPLATFRIEKLLDSSSNRLPNQKPVILRLRGKLAIRGVSKTINIKLKLIYFKENKETKVRLSGNLLRIHAKFSIDLTDFKVPWSSKLRLRVARFVKVVVDVLGTDSTLPYELSLPEGEKPKTVPK